MLISVHVPKTAGTSFHRILCESFGARVLHDNGDWPEERSPESLARQGSRREEALARSADFARDYDVIHGHFTAAKYAGLFDPEQLIVFLRDPFQRAVSMYEHALRTKDSPHPRFRHFRDRRMSLLDLIAEVPNHQSLYLAGRPLTDFAVLGLRERFENSLDLIEIATGMELRRDNLHLNVNPHAPAGEYAIDASVRRMVEKHQSDDLHLYATARERFQEMWAENLDALQLRAQRRLAAH